MLAIHPDAGRRKVHPDPFRRLCGHAGQRFRDRRHHSIGELDEGRTGRERGEGIANEPQPRQHRLGDERQAGDDRAGRRAQDVPERVAQAIGIALHHLGLRVPVAQQRAEAGVVLDENETLLVDPALDQCGGDGTGAGSNARAKYTSDKTYSVFNIKMGDVFNGEPGLCMGFGNTEMLGQFYRIDVFDKLENYDAGGIRLVSYIALLLGSKLCLGRVYDVDDVAVLGST